MPPPVKTFGERIADALVEDGLLSAKQVEELLEQQKKEGTRLLKLILDKAYVSEQDMTVSIGRVLNTPPINLPRITIPLDIADLLPREMAHTHKIVPVSRIENKLFLAMADPLNVLAIDDVRRITRLDVAPMIASEKAIVDKLNNIDQLAASSEEAPVIKLEAASWSRLTSSSVSREISIFSASGSSSCFFWASWMMSSMLPLLEASMLLSLSTIAFSRSEER